MGTIRLTAASDRENERIDRFLSANQDRFTRSGLEKLFNSGKIIVNGRITGKNYKLKTGDKIEIIADENKPEISVKPQSLPLNILYEDGHLLVVNKAKGMVVHPSQPGEDGTLVNALMHHCGGRLPASGYEFRPGIVHRIDKDTSGLLVVAKSDEAYENLSEQVFAHTMLRRYEGIVHGVLKNDEGVVDASISRNPSYRTKNCVREGGRHAVTRYRTLRRFGGFSLAEFELETGRMHQIRVHMAHIGHPLAGDAVYGPSKSSVSFKGQCLHAGTLGFTHPETGERLEFSAPPPQYFTMFIKKLEDCM